MNRLPLTLIVLSLTTCSAQLRAAPGDPVSIGIQSAAFDSYSLAVYPAATIDIADPCLLTLTVISDGVECTLYDETLALMLAFDSLSHLHENYKSCDGLVADTSAKGNHGRPGCVWPSLSHLPEWIPEGRHQGALDFKGNGVDLGQSIHIPHSDSLNPGSGDFAIAFWILTRDAYDGDVLRKGSTNTAGTWYKVEHSGGGTHNKISLNFNTDANDATIYSKQPYTDQKWHFVVAQRRADAAQLWVDGSLQGSTVITGRIENTANLAIGSKDTQNDDFLNATLDEVRIYMKSFTPEQIPLLQRCNLAAITADRWRLTIESTTQN